MLLHITFMVKNSGNVFKDVLKHNLSYADKVTILDTGSTDNTVEIIKSITDERVRLYEEPFIDFSTSRNRLLNLSEAHFECKYHIMLDDTYMIQNGDELRSFLENFKNDKINTLSLYLNSLNTIYSSNRIIKGGSGIRYKYRIHEILDCKEGEAGLIPMECGSILDLSSDYMIERTLDRKQKDLLLLFEELEENPNDERILYYLGETYLCIKDYTNAFKYYKERLLYDGFMEEKYDAMYKLAVIADLNLKLPWYIVQQMYLDCYNFNPERPESLFMIGYHYKNNNLAYMFLKQAFEIGIPKNLNMNIKIKQYTESLPKLLIPLCYKNKNFKLGVKTMERVLAYNNNDTEAKYWLSIFSMLNQLGPLKQKNYIKKKTILFVSPGGWSEWGGETLYKSGIGGSETFTIKYAEWLSKDYITTVCCNCTKERRYNNVDYININNLPIFLTNNHIDYAIINRNPEYIYLLDEAKVNNIYFVAHDIAIPGQIIPVPKSLKKLLCISNWAKEQYSNVFKSIDIEKFGAVSYGIDTSKFENYPIQKHSFIYSSFANRGLLELLKMFPKIVERYPDAKLNVFCDLENNWLLTNYKDMVEQIKILLAKHKNFVTNYGWVNQKVLNTFWSKTHIWLYPCTFAETCCLTAYEAAASYTLAITNDLGALPEHSNVVINGDPRSETWQDITISKLFCILEDDKLYNKLITDNYNWVHKEKNFNKVVSDFSNLYLT